MLNNPRYTTAILMATYNGEKFLAKQLDSIINQSNKDWMLYIVDDGSTDNTVNILRDYQKRLGEKKLQVTKQYNQGSTQTFLNLVYNPNIQADYYAYADQDDIWDADKIQHALTCLNQLNLNKPQLYCSATKLIDEEDNFLGNMPLKYSNISFATALESNLAPGNTMVFNQILRNLLLATGIRDVAIHDWWTFLVGAGCGGEIYADTQAFMGYRQHEKNLIGYNHPLKRYVKAFRRILNNDIKKCNKKNLEALQRIHLQLTTDSQLTLKQFEKIITGNIISSSYYVCKSKIYSRNWSSRARAELCVLLRKI